MWLVKKMGIGGVLVLVYGFVFLYNYPQFTYMAQWNSGYNESWSKLDDGDGRTADDMVDSSLVVKVNKDNL